MLLCDTILEAVRLSDHPEALGLSPRAAGSPVMKAQGIAVAELAGGLGQAVRYLIGDDVVRAAVDVAAAKPSSMRDAFPVAHSAHPFLWAEWFDAPRAAARREAGILSVGEQQSMPARRVGCLVRSDTAGRRGDMLFAWTHADQESGRAARIPNVSPLAITFDFDADPALGPPVGRADTDLHQRWQGAPGEYEALSAIEATAGLVPTSGGKSVATALYFAVGNEAAGQYLAQARRDLDGEYLHMLAIMLLLQARNATGFREEDRSRLNQARIRSGKPSLLDHRIAYMRIGEREARAAGAGGGVSGARRAHLVRGHFVTRQGAVFWRRSHVRGVGTPPMKTVKVGI